jgi:hypothetical protein
MVFVGEGMATREKLQRGGIISSSSVASESEKVVIERVFSERMAVFETNLESTKQCREQTDFVDKLLAGFIRRHEFSLQDPCRKSSRRLRWPREDLTNS